MPEHEFGVVYDGGIRDNGTPYYVRVALASILGKDPAWFTEAAPIKDTNCDFLIHVDDGRDDLSVAGIPHPWGYWIIDSHLGPDVRIEKARQADVVWCAQRPFVKKLASLGINSKWLPLACEPLHHPTIQEVNEKGQSVLNMFDVAFVGFMQNPNSSDRLHFLDALIAKFPRSWVAFGYFHQEMAQIYHQACIGINHAVRDDLNMRFFELASIGVPQLADRRMDGLAALGFNEWDHYLPYSTVDEAIHNVQWGLENPDFCRDIAGAAHRLVRYTHTYHHRVREMMRDLADGGTK